MFSSAVYTSFDALPERCLTFLNEFEQSDFFLGNGWFRNFSQNTISTNANVRIYVICEVGDIAATRAVLFMRTPGGQNGSYSEKYFSGAKTIASMTAHQSIRFAPAVNESDEQLDAILDALIQSVCEDDFSWRLVDLNFMNKDSLLYEHLSKAFTDYGMTVRHYNYRPVLFENLSGITFKDFIASRSSMVRKTYIRKSRKLEKSGSVRFELIKANNLSQAINDYKIVHDNSWKEAELFPKHDTGVIEASEKAGALRMGLLYLDNAPVAVQVWIVSSGRATIYKLHYDSNFQQESVGAVLMLRMFEYMIDVEHINEVDFGVGRETAKSHWLKSERSLCGMVAFNPKSVGGLFMLARFSLFIHLNKLKQKLKPGLLTLKKRLFKTNK